MILVLEYWYFLEALSLCVCVYFPDYFHLFICELLSFSLFTTNFQRVISWKPHWQLGLYVQRFKRLYHGCLLCSAMNAISPFSVYSWMSYWKLNPLPLPLIARVQGIWSCSALFNAFMASVSTLGRFYSGRRIIFLCSFCRLSWSVSGEACCHVLWGWANVGFTFFILYF